MLAKSREEWTYPFEDIYEEAALFIADALAARDSSRTLSSRRAVRMYKIYHGPVVSCLQVAFTCLFLLIAFFERPTWCFHVGPDKQCTAWVRNESIPVPVSGLPLLPQIYTQVCASVPTRRRGPSRKSPLFFCCVFFFACLRPHACGLLCHVAMIALCHFMAVSATGRLRSICPNLR